MRFDLVGQQIKHFFIQDAGVFADPEVFMGVGLKSGYKFPVLKHLELTMSVFMVHIICYLELKYFFVF